MKRDARTWLEDADKATGQFEDFTAGSDLDRSWARAKPMMPTGLPERATSFLDSNRVFSRSEFATVVGLQKDADAVGRQFGSP